MSEYLQTSFLGGMNLLSDDTRLKPTEYRLGVNLRNRYDVLDETRGSVLDLVLLNLTSSRFHELVTFGDYLIAFVDGAAYYRPYYNDVWTSITGFTLSPAAPRYWTVAVPLATTLYYRASSSTTGEQADAMGKVRQLNVVSSTLGGNLPGLIVQDNISQPQFIYLLDDGTVVCRTIQNYESWDVEYDLTTGNMLYDRREYVPIGNVMSWVDGILYVTSQDFSSIYRSVSGRPLDFVVNVTVDGLKGGDATTTAYSVGVGNISCLRPLADGSLFVAAGNSNFSVAKNMTQNAPTLWGEYTFIRRFLFESTCLGDRSIIDSLGDTRFIDLTGVRSFNAIQQLNNEGRNSQFTANVQAAFKGIVQDTTAAILFDNYEYYAVNTVFGPAIAVFDTISSCWASFDLDQTGGKKIKQFAKIELGVQRLFAVTEDNKLYTLYSSAEYVTSTLLTGGISASVLNNDQSVRLTNAKTEVKPLEFRAILNRITQDSVVTLTPIVDNRVSTTGAVAKEVTYSEPTTALTGTLLIPDINTQLSNLLFSLPNCEQGWKVSFQLSWTGGGSITQFYVMLKDESPRNPLKSQGNTK